MRYVALATDYDGTLAHDGCVTPATVAALENCAATGRKLLLVTGRKLDDLRTVFRTLDIFEWLVVENGAVLHRPKSGVTRVLAPPPPAVFVAELERRGVTPLSVGDSVVATWQPNEKVVLEVIRDLGLELHVIFNKGAVMVLPARTNKASGVEAALRELGLSAHNLVAIGDAENDHAMLEMAECSVVVANAVPMLKAKADLVTRGDHGAGVEELVARLVDNDLSDIASPREEQQLTLGTKLDGTAVRLPVFGPNLLISGTSGSGKSTLATGLLEQLMARGYQCCVVDPEGDYDELGEVIRFGSPKHAPDLGAILSGLEQPDTNVVVNLLGVKLNERPDFFATLLLRLQEHRARAGRPHWIVVDEAHHLLPTDWEPAPQVMTSTVNSMIFVTVHPESLSRAVLERLDVIAVTGENPELRIAQVAEQAGATPYSRDAVQLEPGEALVWLRRSNEAPFKVRASASTGERRRHQRKYAEGQLGEDRSFYFRGPDGRLNLRAQNLMLFMQLADGVDDSTWRYHLARGDFSRWMRESIKDAELANDVEIVEEEAERLAPSQSRDRVRKAIETRYTLAAEGATSAGHS
ncbi:MAG TPA: HAD family hydrolase [Steroidobacteraceae bacterium]|nr:HAD family hydrolase [Steroidobacteraceae bacterium]